MDSMLILCDLPCLARPIGSHFLISRVESSFISVLRSMTLSCYFFVQKTLTFASLSLVSVQQKY